MELKTFADTFSQISLKNSLALHVTIESLIQACVDAIQMVPKYEALKNDVELLIWVARCIKDVFYKNSLGTKEDQDTTICSVMTHVFSLNGPEQEGLKRALKFLRSNKLIKRIPYVSRALLCFSKKKVLF